MRGTAGGRNGSPVPFPARSALAGLIAAKRTSPAVPLGLLPNRRKADIFRTMVSSITVLTAPHCSLPLLAGLLLRPART